MRTLGIKCTDACVPEVNPKLALRLELDNLFDETYYTNSFSDLWVQPGAPISWRVSMELQL